MVTFLLIIAITSIAFSILLYLSNERKKEEIEELKKIIYNDVQKINTIAEEKEVLQMELGFVKSIYRSKLLKLGTDSKKNLSTKKVD